MGGRSRFAMACLAVAVVLGGLGTVGLASASAAVASRDVVADGVHLLVVEPTSEAAGPRRPGVVVVHGFAGSALLMRGFGDTLAAQGYVVVLPDVAGHGADTGRLRLNSDGRTQPSESDVDAAVRYLRSLPGVDPERIALVGHSMGAGLVTRYAAGHPEIPATVAISLPSASDLIADPTRPRDLLLIVGGAEFAGFRQSADEAMAAGAARRAVTVPNVEHISVLYATRTHEETAAWLATALSVSPTTDAVHPRDRLLPAAALLAAFVLAFVPLALLVLPRREDPGPTKTPIWYALGGLGAGLVAAVALANVAPTTRLPIAVGGHATGFFALAGLGLLGGWGLGRARQRSTAPSRRSVVAAVVLTAYAAAAIAVPAQLGLTHMVPVGARWWLLPIVASGTFVLLLGTELLAAGAGWRRPVILAAVAVALLAATLVGLAPGFGLLVLPLLVILLAWQAAWAWWLRGLAAPAWLAAAVGAVVVAWPIAATLPLV